MLALMGRVWKKEVGTLNYRHPISDGSRGGNGKFDVYLKDLYPKGYYGYCAPERPTSYNAYLYSGFCVLDNNFAKREYGAPPMASATVTAAHEFFHAVQFAYDTGEDGWFMEATATWMEERFNDKSNDNRQYIPYSQARMPSTPLDYFNSGGFSQYGNWLYFEYLSSHFGNGIVHRIWDRAFAHGRRHNAFSTKAVAAVLAHKNGKFPGVFARYAAGNTTPARNYPEGSHYKPAPYKVTKALGKDKQSTGWQTFRLRHLTNSNLKVRSGKSLQARSWKIRIKVNGPGRSRSPVAFAIVHRRHGKNIRTPIHLSRRGNGKIVFGFSHRQVSFVSVTVANASSQFSKCNTGTVYSCRGVARFGRYPIRVKAVAFHR
jgi:hypothetical protein